MKKADKEQKKIEAKVYAHYGTVSKTQLYSKASEVIREELPSLERCDWMVETLWEKDKEECKNLTKDLLQTSVLAIKMKNTKDLETLIFDWLATIELIADTNAEEILQSMEETKRGQNVSDAKEFFEGIGINLK